MQKRAALSLFITLILSSMCARGEGLVYKCKNQQGTLVYQKTQCKDNNETVTSWLPLELSKPPASIPQTEQDKNANKPEAVLKLKQNLSGHYATEASINNKSLGFIVDTGASMIALPEATAHSAGIYCDNKAKINTANGISEACTAKIKILQFGPFSLKDVPTLIAPHLSQSLLGMNVLQLFKIAQADGEMHISAPQK